MSKSSFEEEIQRSGYLIYRNVGDSMLPLIRQGRDLVLISRKPEGRLRRYDVPLYRRESGQYVLHRIVKVRRDDYVLCGDNRWRLEEGISDRHIIGVLTAVIRNGRRLPVTDWRYRLYVCLWCGLRPVRALALWCRDLPKRIRRKLCR
ncbi:MAG: S24/S26 family peptidase [bacterium]|nr:S24/S26 family peptidase [bacterium]